MNLIPLMDLLVEICRWFIGLGMVIFAWYVLRKCFTLPKDELEVPDHMVKIRWRIR